MVINSAIFFLTISHLLFSSKGEFSGDLKETGSFSRSKHSILQQEDIQNESDNGPELEIYQQSNMMTQNCLPPQAQMVCVLEKKKKKKEIELTKMA